MSKNDFDKELQKAKNAVDNISAKKAKLEAMMKELQFQEEKNNVSSLYGNSIVDIIHKINPDIDLRSMAVLNGLEIFLVDKADDFNALINTLIEKEKIDKEQQLKEKKERSARKKAEKKNMVTVNEISDNMHDVSENRNEENPVEKNSAEEDLIYDSGEAEVLDDDDDADAEIDYDSL